MENQDNLKKTIECVIDKIINTKKLNEDETIQRLGTKVFFHLHYV